MNGGPGYHRLPKPKALNLLRRISWHLQLYFRRSRNGGRPAVFLVSQSKSSVMEAASTFSLLEDAAASTEGVQAEIAERELETMRRSEMLQAPADYGIK